MAENDLRIINATEADIGKLWIIRENGGGRADLRRKRSPRQYEWLKRAIDRGWLNDEGWLTSAGRNLAGLWSEDEDG